MSVVRNPVRRLMGVSAPRAGVAPQLPTLDVARKSQKSGRLDSRNGPLAPDAGCPIERGRLRSGPSLAPHDHALAELTASSNGGMFEQKGLLS